MCKSDFHAELPEVAALGVEVAAAVAVDREVALAARHFALCRFPSRLLNSLVLLEREAMGRTSAAIAIATRPAGCSGADGGPLFPYTVDHLRAAARFAVAAAAAETELDAS
jgi:hypothetical protein